MSTRFHPLTRLATLIALAAPALAWSAPPQTGYLEQAQTQAAGTQIRSYGMPATDELGKISYWDVTIDLTIGTNGKPAGSANVTSAKQVPLKSNRLVPGTYTDNWGGNCTVITTNLPSGRQEASVACATATVQWNFSVISGDIPGHPFELQLTNANIQGIPGYRDYNWGVDGATNNNYGGCFYTNYIVSARQVGSQIVVTRYGADNIGDCGANLAKVP